MLFQDIVYPSWILQTTCPLLSFPFTLRLVPMCVNSSSILTFSYWDTSASQSLSLQTSQDAQLFFWASPIGNTIFVQIILATSPVYSMLKNEPLYVHQSGSLVALSQAAGEVKAGVFPWWRTNTVTGCASTEEVKHQWERQCQLWLFVMLTFSSNNDAPAHQIATCSHSAWSL